MDSVERVLLMLMLMLVMTTTTMKVNVGMSVRWQWVIVVVGSRAYGRRCKRVTWRARRVTWGKGGLTGCRGKGRCVPEAGMTLLLDDRLCICKAG